MDLTAFAAGLLEPIPAHRTLGIAVVDANEGRGEVSMEVTPELTNVIGSLHSSGLAALVDATGLAAVISAAGDPERFEGVTPLGTVAHLEFRAPARGRLVGRCALEHPELVALGTLYSGERDRVQIDTVVDVTDEHGMVVCRGAFTWKIRRA